MAAAFLSFSSGLSLATNSSSNSAFVARHPTFPINSIKAIKGLPKSKRSSSNTVQVNAVVVAVASIFPFLKKKDKQEVKQELLDAIAPLDRGAGASPDDIARVEKIAQSLESLNPVKSTINSPLINGKWELLYTTSESIVKKSRPKLLRPSGPIFQAINNDTLRAQNIETWPFFSQVTANLTPLSARKVAVKFDVFKIAALISIKAPDSARGELEITYLDEELRVSRGDKGNLFILKMVDPTYRVPT